MGRIFGLLLSVLGIWAATEVYLHGMDGAFGGAFASGESGARPDPRSLPQRAGDSVRGSQAQEAARRDKLLAE